MRFPWLSRQLWCVRRRIPIAPIGLDAPTPARLVGLPPRGGQYFLSKQKKVPKKAGGTATPEAARPAVRNSQISAFRALPCPALVFAQACQSLTAYGSCAHWARAPSRPKLRPAVAPLGLSSALVRCAHPPRKRPAHFDGGARNVARNEVGRLSHTGVARSCSPFSLRCLSPLCSPRSWRVADSNDAAWDALRRSLDIPVT